MVRVTRAPEATSLIPVERRTKVKVSIFLYSPHSFLAAPGITSHASDVGGSVTSDNGACLTFVISDEHQLLPVAARIS